MISCNFLFEFVSQEGCFVFTNRYEADPCTTVAKTSRREGRKHFIVFYVQRLEDTKSMMSITISVKIDSLASLNIKVH